MVAVQKKTPDAVDVRAGSRLRMARRLKKMSQSELGRQLGVTFQQIQKYEKGTNRISASRIAAAANILGVLPSFFFDETEGPAPASASASNEMNRLVDLIASGEALELNSHFARIKSPEKRKAVVALVDAISKAQGNDD